MAIVGLRLVTAFLTKLAEAALTDLTVGQLIHIIEKLLRLLGA